MSTDLIDIKFENGRWVFDASGDVVFIRGAERVRQQLEFHMSLWAGEWFLDPDFGVPYNPQVLGKLGGSALTLDAVIAVLREQMLSVDGVMSITTFDYSFDPATRFLRIDAELMSEFGIVAYTNAASAPVDDTQPVEPENVIPAPINMFTSKLDPRVTVVSASPSYYRGLDGHLQIAPDSNWPLWYSDYKLAGRLAPDFAYVNRFPDRQLLTGWTASGGDVLTGEESPDGLDNGLLFNGNGTPPRLLKSPELSAQGANISPGANQSLGFFFKAADNVSKVRVKVRNITGAAVVASLLLDVKKGTITENPNAVIRPAFEYFGNGWYMLGFGMRWTGVAGKGQIEISAEDFTGDAYSIGVWGPLQALATTDIRGTQPVDDYKAPVIDVMRVGNATAVEVFYTGRANEVIPFNGAPSVRIKGNSLNSWGKTFITRIEYKV